MSETPRVLLHNAETQSLAQQLKATFPQVKVAECNDYETLPAQLKAFQPQVVYSVRFAGTPGFPRAALFGPNGPRWLANGGAGTDHYGIWNKAQTTVTNAAGVAAGMMAEYVLGGFLHFTLDVPGLQKDKAARVWNARTVVPLAGKTLVIVGLGHTGRAIAQRAKAFGMTVLGTRARPEDMDNVDEVHASDDLQALLPRADFIAICLPLTAATRGLFDRHAIDALKPGAILADVSRGGIVDQSALHDALRSGRLAGAALDVFEVEPLPEDSPLWALDNVILSPHCSSVSAEWEADSFGLFLDNLSRWMEGRDLMNIVDPARGY